jgi:putative transposase
MPRSSRVQAAGLIYHVINRGNGGVAIFHKDLDYLAFVGLLAQARSSFPVQVFGYCMMPNHFHLVLQPMAEGAMSMFMHWWLTTHTQRYRAHYGGCGHVWQGRYKSFAIQQDRHFLAVLRYVLRNPVRGGLVRTPGDWAWSSLAFPRTVDPWPVETPADWPQQIHEPITGDELARLRVSLNRQAPYGSPEWQEGTAKRLGLGTTLRPRGRPKKGTVPFF